jgi:hypothetical protein
MGLRSWSSLTMEEIVPHPGGGLHRACALVGRVSKVEMAAPRVLIYKELFPSISTFETPPKRVMASGTNDKRDYQA